MNESYQSSEFELERRERDPFKLVTTLFCAAYFLWAALHPESWRMIDGVNLIIHEAGHIIFMPFGEFLMIAGGSLFQVIVPAVFAGYFFYHEQRFSAALVLFWMGESLLNVSVYADDSIALQLPLLGGEGTIHDWNYMLVRAGFIKHTEAISKLIRLAGTLTIIAASVIAFINARKSTEKLPL